MTLNWFVIDGRVFLIPKTPVGAVVPPVTQRRQAAPSDALLPASDGAHRPLPPGVGKRNQR